ncbi:MAG: hypothetical protein WKF57_12865 [Nakamurella sp.]
MMRTPGLLMLMLMLMAVSATIASCLAAPGTGPLANTDPGFSIGICGPAGVGESVSFGPANWINPTAEPLTIDYLGLVDPDGVELVGAFVVPNPGDGHGGGAGIGASHGFPPEPYEGDTLSWDEQQSLPGAVLPPQVQMDLVIGVRHTRRDQGSASSLLVLYHSPSENFIYRLPARIELGSAAGCS